MKQVLVVDDNAQIREVLMQMLEIWGEMQGLELNIVELIHGKEALDWVEERGKPDLILLDVRMPVMSGADFIKHVSHLGMDVRGITLLLTGYADDLEEYLGNDALLMKHLRKPFMADELFAALETMNIA